MQDRSRALLERVLMSAGEAFDELGVDACSTEEIARRAGVSIGSVYRLFPNKAAIAEALAERYALEHDAAAALQFTAASLARPAEEIISDFFDVFSSLVATQPGWQGLGRAGYLFGGDPVPNANWDRQLEAFFATQVPTLGPASRRRAARTFRALSGWLLFHAVGSDDQLRKALKEAETVMVGYVHELRRRDI